MFSYMCIWLILVTIQLSGHLSQFSHCTYLFLLFLPYSQLVILLTYGTWILPLYSAIRNKFVGLALH